MEALSQYLFIDIETAPVVENFSELSENMQDHWLRKMKITKPAESVNVIPEDLFVEKAGVYSEFARVVCIGIGCLEHKEDGWKIYLKSLTGTDENALLHSFCSAITQFLEQRKKLVFCGHNIKEFDLPFLSRRMVIHGMSLPDCLDHGGKKPWEVSHVDTMELWAFGDRKNYTTLALLAEVLGIPSPKDDINGADVGRVFWQEKNAQRIATYCLKDVFTTAKIFLRLKNLQKKIDPAPVYLQEAAQE